MRDSGPSPWVFDIFRKPRPFSGHKKFLSPRGERNWDERRSGVVVRRDHGNDVVPRTANQP